MKENLKKLRENLDKTSMVVISVTLVLFIFALFTKAFIHDLLLEAAIFLVSVKLIIGSYKQSVASKRLERQLKGIDEKIDRFLGSK